MARPDIAATLPGLMGWGGEIPEDMEGTDYESESPWESERTRGGASLRYRAVTRSSYTPRDRLPRGIAVHCPPQSGRGIAKQFVVQYTRLRRV